MAMFDSLLRAPSWRAVSSGSLAEQPHAKSAGGRSLRVMLVQPQAEHAGAQEIARLLAGGLAARGHCVIQTFFFRRTARFQAGGPTAFCADERPRTLFGLLRLLAGLRREIRAFRPDAVLCFQHYGNVIAAPVARIAGAPVVIANQNTDALSIPAAARLLDRWLGRLGVYDRIIAVSASAEAGYRKHPANYRRRLRLIEHGIAVKKSDLTKEGARTRLGLPQEGVLLGCAARLHPMKNLEAALQLLAREPHWRLAFAGQGPDLVRLQRIAAEIGCSERVHWLGELSPDDVAHFLRALDVFVFPSLSESFGLAAAEAALAGVPVVANDLPALREVLASGGAPCAVLTCARDPGQFHAAVAGLLQDETRMASLAARGRELGMRYSVGSMVNAYERLLNDLASERAK